MVNGYTQLHATVNENYITYYVNTPFLVNNESLIIWISL